MKVVDSLGVLSNLLLDAEFTLLGKLHLLSLDELFSLLLLSQRLFLRFLLEVINSFLVLLGQLSNLNLVVLLGLSQFILQLGNFTLKSLLFLHQDLLMVLGLVVQVLLQFVVFLLQLVFELLHLTLVLLIDALDLLSGISLFVVSDLSLLR